MDQPSDDSPCKRLRVSEGNYIDEETGMVIDGNLIQEGAGEGAGAGAGARDGAGDREGARAGAGAGDGARAGAGAGDRDGAGDGARAGAGDRDGAGDGARAGAGAGDRDGAGAGDGARAGAGDRDGAGPGDDGQSKVSRGECDTTDADMLNTSDRIVDSSGSMVNKYSLPRTGPSILDRSMPDVLHITNNCGHGYQSVANTESESSDSGVLSTGSTYKNQCEGSVEMGKQSSDRVWTCFQLENENVATCAGISISNLDDISNMDSFNDATNTDLVHDAAKFDTVNPESAGNAPKREPNTGICGYVQNIHAIADSSYSKLRENTCMVSTYNRNTSRSKTEHIPNLESPKLKRTLDRANTNLAKKRMESVIDSTVDEARNSKSLADSHFKEVCRRECARAEQSTGSCSGNNCTENEKGDGETESKLEEPVKDIESGTIFLAGPEREENQEANFNIHSHTSMKIHAVDTIETDERSIDIHRNNRKKTVRQFDLSESTKQVSSDMHGDAKKELITNHKDLDENIIMHRSTLMQNHFDMDDNKNNSNASGSGILPPEDTDDSGFMELFSNSSVGGMMSCDVMKGSSLTWNYGKKSMTGHMSQGSLTLSRKTVTDSREANLACSFGELNNLLEDISGGNMNEGHDRDLVHVGVANRNNTLDNSLTFVPSSSVQNITCSQSSSSPRSYSKTSMCSQSSASSRSSANSRTCSESSSSLRSNTSVFSASSSESTTLQTQKLPASFQTFHVPTATASTSNSNRTDSLAFNDTVHTNLYQVSHGVEAHIPQCRALYLDGVNTEQDSKELAEDEQGLKLIDERFKLDVNHVRDGVNTVIDTNKDLKKSGNDKHGLALIDGRLKLDFDQTQDIISGNNINSLPITVLLKILKHLTVFELLLRASLVCKYWYNLCRDSDIWRNVYLANQDRLADEDLIRLLTFGEHRVRNINLTDCRFVTDYGFKYLLRNCPQIEVLQVMRCFDLTDLAFKGLHRKGRCSKLYSLHLDGCCRIGTKALFELSEACPSMRDLHLNQCMVCDAGITSVARRCPNLVNLQLDHCTRVTDDGVSEIVLGCPGMMYLNLMSCSITERGVKYLSKLLKLRSVDLSNIPRMTSDSVIYMSRFCKDLQCVNVSLNMAVDDDCIAQLARNLPLLKKLYCVSCSLSDKGLQDIAKYRPTIETLDVSWCQEVTDHGVRVISLACNHLDCFGLIRCDSVSVETIEELVFRYPRIKYSTFFLESRKLLDRARSEGYTLNLPGFKPRNSQKV